MRKDLKIESVWNGIINGIDSPTGHTGDVGQNE